MTGNPLLYLCLFSAVGCAIGDNSQPSDPSDPPYYGGAPAPTDGDDGPGLPAPQGTATESPRGLIAPTNCAASHEPSVYWPIAPDAPAVLGTPEEYPWWGQGAYAPEGSELDLGAFPAGQTIECGSNKSVRSYLDVTAGCLDAVAFDGATRGQIHGTSDGYYRSFALPADSDDPAMKVKWTDQGGEYDFYYTGWTGNVSYPGFKIFARYLTEYDLYVASWREDGVVQIQKKQCGVYTILKRIPNYPPPTPNAWHHIRFEVNGNDLKLYTDGQLAVETTDNTFAAGTSGIRIDDAEGAYLANWHVFAP